MHPARGPSRSSLALISCLFQIKIAVISSQYYSPSMDQVGRLQSSLKSVRPTGLLLPMLMNYINNCPLRNTGRYLDHRYSEYT